VLLDFCTFLQQLAFPCFITPTPHFIALTPSLVLGDSSKQYLLELLSLDNELVLQLLVASIEFSTSSLMDCENVAREIPSIPPFDMGARKRKHIVAL
jgi:hypothetical protein